MSYRELLIGCGNSRIVIISDNNDVTIGATAVAAAAGGVGVALATVLRCSPRRTRRAPVRHVAHLLTQTGRAPH